MLRGFASLQPNAPALRARPGATRAMAVALLVVVGLAGIGLGFAADRLALHNARTMVHRPPPPSFGSFRGPGGAGVGNGGGGGGGGGGGREGHRDGMRERLVRELDLTPEQQRRVDSIMARQTEDFRRLREAMRPRFDSLLLDAQARLDSVLTPAQREKLQALRAREVFGPRDNFGGRDRRPPQFP